MMPPQDPSRFDDPNGAELLPRQASDALRGLFGSAQAPPDPEADRALLELAESTLTRRAAPRRWLKPAIAAAAFGLVITGVAVISQLGGITNPQSPPSTLAASSPIGDANNDGRTDVLDAFLMARTLDSGGATPAAWDSNADGAVDQRDVDHVMTLAVSLSPTGNGGVR